MFKSVGDSLLLAEIDAIEEKVNSEIVPLAKEVEDLTTQFESAIKPLRDGGWLGQGAQSFYDTYDTYIKPVIPGYSDRTQALSNNLLKALEDIKQADLQAKNTVDELSQALAAVQDFNNL